MGNSDTYTDQDAGFWVTYTNSDGTQTRFFLKTDPPAEVSAPTTVASAAAGSPAPLPTDQLTPQEMVYAVAGANPKTEGGVSGILSAFWNSPIRNWVLLGLGLTALGIGLYLGLHSHSSQPNTSQKMTQAQADVAARQLAKQIAGTTGVLKTDGYNTETIERAQNAAALVYGTDIVEATANPRMTEPVKAFVVTGVSSPEHYASLETVDTRAYLKSLSEHPSAANIIQNSAAVHGLSIDTQK